MKKEPVAKCPGSFYYLQIPLIIVYLALIMKLVYLAVIFIAVIMFVRTMRR